MRKSLLIILAVMFVAAISSCTKKYITPNNNITVVAKDVRPNSWVLNTAEAAYTNDILVPDLDDYFNDVGAVLVYLSFSKGIYEQIPYVYNGVSYSFFHERGKVVLYAQTPGGQPIKPVDVMDVKVVLIDSNDPGL